MQPLELGEQAYGFGELYPESLQGQLVLSTGKPPLQPPA